MTPPAESEFLTAFKTLFGEGNRAWNEHDFQRAYGGLPDGFVYQLGPAWPEAGQVFHGPDEVIAFFEQLCEVFPDIRSGPITYIEVDDRTAITGMQVHATGRESGTRTAMEVWQVWEVNESMVPIRVTEHIDREAALNAAGAKDPVKEDAR